MSRLCDRWELCGKDYGFTKSLGVLILFYSAAWITLFLAALCGRIAEAQTGAPNAAATTDEASATKAESPPWPEAVILPWRTLGIDAHAIAPVRQALQEVRQNIQNRWLTNPQDLSVATAANPYLTLNARRIARQIVTGNFRNGTAIPLAIEPVWCSIMDQQLFFVTLSDLEKHTILASAHVAIPTEEWQRIAAGGNAAGTLTGRLPLAAALARLPQGPTPTDDALFVGLRLGHHATRKDEGSSFCLNLLLAERLAEEYTIPRFVGGDQLATIRRLLPKPAKLRRPTRTIITRWLQDPKNPRQLPATFRLIATFAETVLGQRIDATDKSDWTFRRQGALIQFDIAPTMTQFLTGEKEALNLDDYPQIAKVDRAWVYLDRGRAWGLKMNDRLVAQSGDVKGHVVRFFGPAQGLKSPRGFPIREGAIVYIRKGQRKTKVGMEFRFDPRQFPTPWPPKEGM